MPSCGKRRRTSDSYSSRSVARSTSAHGDRHNATSGKDYRCSGTRATTNGSKTTVGTEVYPLPLLVISTAITVCKDTIAVAAIPVPPPPVKDTTGTAAYPEPTLVTAMASADESPRVAVARCPCAVAGDGHRWSNCILSA